MPHITRATLLVAGALLTASCSDTDARLFSTQPSGITSSSVGIETASDTVIAQAVDNPFCPAISPFTVPLDLTVRANGSSTVIVRGVRLLFTDTAGRRAPEVTLPMLPVTLPAPGPTAQFGIVLQAGSAQRFPLFFGIGCGTGRRGTVVIIVDTSDENGRQRSDQIRVAVR
jgi:hypothetical protein